MVAVDQHLSSDDEEHHLDQALRGAPHQHDRQLNADHQEQGVREHLLEGVGQPAVVNVVAEIEDEARNEQNDAVTGKQQGDTCDSDLRPVKDVGEVPQDCVRLGLALSLIGCYQGYSVRGGAREVGLAVNRAVVLGIGMIFVLNYLITAYFF